MYSPYGSPYISYKTSKENLSKYQASSDSVKRNYIFVTVRAFKKG